jgi:hypothetical protein
VVVVVVDGNPPELTLMVEVEPPVAVAEVLAITGRRTPRAPVALVLMSRSMEPFTLDELAVTALSMFLVETRRGPVVVQAVQQGMDLLDLELHRTFPSLEL